MSLEDLLSVWSLLLLPAVGMWFLRVHLRETARGRSQSVRMQIEELTLQAGETVVGVLDRRHGPTIFLVQETTERPHDA